MTQKELSQITWQLSGVYHHGVEVIQVLVAEKYGFQNKVHKIIKPNGDPEIWGEYIYKGKSYKTWDEFAEAVKDVKFIPDNDDYEEDDWDDDEWEDDEWEDGF